MDRGDFSEHLAFFSSWPHSRLFGGSKQNPSIVIRPGIDGHNIEANGQSHTLFVKRTVTEMFAFHVQPDSRRYVLSHLAENKFLVALAADGQQFEMRSENSKRIMCGKDGGAVALFETGWTDEDSRKKVRYWLHWNGDVPMTVLALFFCIALKFDPLPRAEFNVD